MSHKKMWKKIFNDTDKYVDFYFKEKAKRSIVYSKYVEEKLVSMAFFTPYQMMYKGKECVCPYIVGVATQKEHRHKGYMKTLLQQGILDFRFPEAKVAFLCPVDPKIYEGLGFQGVYYRKKIEVLGNKKKWYGVVSFSRMELGNRKKAAEFAAAQLYTSEFDLYMCRSVDYYELLDKEMKALGGKVIVLREGEFVKGVAAYIREDDTYEVTEVICDPEDGKKVLESICAYLAEEEDKQVVFNDSYFIGEITGDGIRSVQEDKPYIMARTLDESENITRLKVYINDIT